MSDGAREPAASAVPVDHYRPCIIIPFYRHEGAIGAMVQQLKPYGLDCWIVDDGSGAPSHDVLQDIAAREADWVHLHGYPQNRGKGVAVMTGCAEARAAGYTHAIQIDADGQHDTTDLPRLLALSRVHPAALVTAIPVYDQSVPKARFYGRYLTHACVWVETLSLQIRDSMCGFRIYPLEPALAAWQRGGVGRRMDFDTSIMVRMYWQGTTVLSLPSKVTYPSDGVSHFDLLRDNLRMIRLHLRLLAGMCLRLPWLLWQRLRPAP